MIFAALAVPNFRLYFVGQAVSLTGTWMQVVAQSWLVLELTGSGTALGLVVAAQFLPVLVFGAYGGLIADRVNKRRLLLCTQSALAGLALLLGLLTVTHAVRLWMVFVLAFALGTVNAVDMPTRQTFVPEMVGRERLQNAVSLNSVLTSAARAVGPATAGVLIATTGVGVCFLLNAASFLAVLAALAAMRASALRPAPRAGREPGQLRAGFRYVRAVPALLAPLLMMALIGTLAYEFQIALPLLARISLHGGADTYGFLTSAMGLGAVVGGLAVAASQRAGLVTVIAAAAGFGLAILAAALVRSLPAELAALMVVGGCGTAFIATGNSTLQLTADPRFRGRVMALWSVTFTGSTPSAGPSSAASPTASGHGMRSGSARQPASPQPCSARRCWPGCRPRSGTRAAPAISTGGPITRHATLHWIGDSRSGPRTHRPGVRARRVRHTAQPLRLISFQDPYRVPALPRGGLDGAHEGCRGQRGNLGASDLLPGSEARDTTWWRWARRWPRWPRCRRVR